MNKNPLMAGNGNPPPPTRKVPEPMKPGKKK